MDAFEVKEVLARLDTSGRANGERPADASPGHQFAEFFRAASGKLSLTIAFWPAGGEDPQEPHTEDEVYYVANGRGQIRVDGEDQAVQPGSIVYVAAGVEHKFHSIEEDLEVVVFWSPARAPYDA